MVFIGLIFAMISLAVSIPKSQIDTEFDTEQKGNLVGKVDNIVRKKERMTITLSNASFQKEGEKSNYFLEKILVYADNSSVHLGNQILVKGILTKIQTPKNPGEFNSYYYYNSKHIHYLMRNGKIDILDRKKDWLMTYLNFGKERIEAVYNKWLPKSQAEVLCAMFLGDKSDLSDDTKRLYQKNGMSHLLAISGLHVSLIGLGIYHLIQKLLKRKKVAAIFSVISIFLYGSMTGFSISTNRAVIMMVIYFVSILIGRTYDMISAAALAASIILAFHPLEIRNAGFLLSFGAVIGICLVYPMLATIFMELLEMQVKKISGQNQVLSKGWIHNVISAILVSSSIQLITLPILLNNFYEYPVFGILINLIVLPLMSLLASLSVVAGLVGMLWINFAGVFAGGIYVILNIYEKVAKIGILLPHAIQITGKPKPSFFILYYLLLLLILLLYYVTKKKRVWFLLVLVFAIPILPKNPGMKVTFLDVGQGDSIYIETADNLKILVDGGSSTKSKIGQYVLEPFLKSQGCRVLDYVFITHLDEDHYNGILELIEFTDFGGVAIENVVLGAGIEEDESYDALIGLLKRHKVNLLYIKRDESINKEAFNLHCINPSGVGESSDKNDESIGLEVSFGEFSMVLTGDMEASEKVAMHYLKRDHYQILKVGHHGSKSSSSLSFLQRVKPAYAVISCAKKNRYGHPSEETLARLEYVNTGVYATKDGGAVCVQTDGKKFVLDYFVNILYNSKWT
ncbi:MAG: DNA internalization-related competence protein ComEC/Rec2 [Velocimicrobium sp.]